MARAPAPERLSAALRRPGPACVVLGAVALLCALVGGGQCGFGTNGPILEAARMDSLDMQEDARAASTAASLIFREVPLRSLRHDFAEFLPEVDGISYVAKVTRGLYRGSFPEDEGVDWLRSHGVRTIINLNGGSSKSYRKYVQELGLRYEHLPLSPTHRPSEQQVDRFFSIVTDWFAYPIYVHCLHGVDRTGTMIALYRMREQGWGNKEALAEMIYFGDHGFSALREFVASYHP